MGWVQSFLLTSLLTLVALVNADRQVVSQFSAGNGCSIAAASTRTGFDVNFYNYLPGDVLNIQLDDFVANDYTTDQTILTTATGVTAPNFSFALNLVSQTIYGGLVIRLSNVLIEYKGYFQATETGVFRVTFNQMDDGAFLWLGSEAAFNCCQQTIPEQSYDDVLLAVRDDGSYASYVYLEEGTFYPMRIVYINVALASIMQFQIMAPSGDIYTNFDDTVFNFDVSDMSVCAVVNGANTLDVSTIYSFTDVATTTQDYFTDSVTHNAQGVASTYMIENVVLPNPTQTITVTSHGNQDRTFTTTVATKDGNSFVATAQVVIELADGTGTDTTTTTKEDVTTIINTSTEAGTGCIFASHYFATQTGFHAKFYDYRGNFLNSQYVGNSYTTESTITTVSGVTNPNFAVLAIPLFNQNIYGASIQTWGGYVLELTGYFVATETGLYVFRIYNIDDSAMVWLGSQMAFNCCQQQIPFGSSDEYFMFIIDYNGHVGFVQMDAGVYYPMRVVLVNWSGNSELHMSIDTPSESIRNDWSKYIVQISDIQDGACLPADQGTFAY